MALRHRTEQEEPKLKGVDRARDSTKFKLGQFRTLQNWVPAHVYSIKKKRGVELLDSTGEVQIPGPCGGAVCLDATDRGQQVITAAAYFIQDLSLVAPLDPLDTNLRTSWGHISPTDEVYTMIGAATCAGGNMAYYDQCAQVNRFQTPAVLTHPALIDPNSMLPAINTRLGVSDEPVYAFSTSQDGFFYYPEIDFVDSMFYSITTQLGGNLRWQGSGGEQGNSTFAKIGNTIYFNTYDNSLAHPNRFNIASFLVSDGAAILTLWSTGLGAFVIGYMHVTSNYLYAIGYLVDAMAVIIPFSACIKKIDRSNGNIVATFQLDNLPIYHIAVVDDTMIYLIGTLNGQIGVWYITNFTTLKFLGHCVDSGLFSPFGHGRGAFVNGRLYWGQSGFAGYSCNINSIETSCGSGEQPAVSVVQASVIDGDYVTVEWSNSLAPSNQHAILVAAPPAGYLGYHNILASIATGDTSSGSVGLQVPDGTAPGTYIVMLTEADTAIYVTSSQSFTVAADVASPPPFDDTNLFLWLDAGQVPGYSDGDPVNRWRDRSSALFHDFYPNSNGERPLYRTTAVTINNLPVLSFDGVNDRLKGSDPSNNSTFDSSAFTAATIFIVGRLNLDPPVEESKSGLWVFNSAGLTHAFPWTDSVIYDDTFTTVRKTLGDPGPSLTSPFQYNVRSINGEWSSKLNGAVLFSTAVNTFLGLAFGANIGMSADGRRYNGVIAEVIVFDTNLSDVARSDIETYLATKYAL